MTETTSQFPTAAEAMLERAGQVLELTRREWRPVERPLRRPARARREHAHYGYDQGFPAEMMHEAHGFQRPSHY
ncbi:MAG: hypothetical protein WCX93_11880 [Burkholderiaceae bacterium]